MTREREREARGTSVYWARRCNWNSLEVAGIIRSPKRAKSERVVELVIGNMSGWILQDVGSVARPWEHPLSGVADHHRHPLPPVPLVPPTSGSDDGGRGEAGIKLSFILAGTLTLCTVRKLVLCPGYTLPYRSALLILGSAGHRAVVSSLPVCVLTLVIASILRDRQNSEARRSGKCDLAPLKPTRYEILTNKLLVE